MFVGTHLRAPHPEGATDNDFIGLRSLRDFDVSALQCRGRGTARGQVLDELRFARLAVAILRKPESAVGGELRRGDKRITHKRSAEGAALEEPESSLLDGVESQSQQT